MQKKELVNILSEILLPIGFKKKGNYWIMDGAEITKMVNLQKSQFSNSFYINYGYILNAVPLNGLTMHIFKGLSSLDSNKNARIKELLNLENDMSNEERASELKKVLLEKLVYKISSVSMEADILEELKKQPNLNNIPLVVKRYFKLPQ